MKNIVQITLILFVLLNIVLSSQLLKKKHHKHKDELKTQQQVLYSPPDKLEGDHQFCSTANQDDILKLTCDDANIKSIIWADYGKTNARCDFPIIYDDFNQNQVSSLIRRLCVGKHKCDIHVTNSLLGNPFWAMLSSKTFRVVYECGKTARELQYEMNNDINTNFQSILNTLKKTGDQDLELYKKQNQTAIDAYKKFTDAIQHQHTDDWKNLQVIGQAGLDQEQILEQDNDKLTKNLRDQEEITNRIIQITNYFLEYEREVQGDENNEKVMSDYTAAKVVKEQELEKLNDLLTKLREDMTQSNIRRSDEKQAPKIEDIIVETRTHSGGVMAELLNRSQQQEQADKNSAVALEILSVSENLAYDLFKALMDTLPELKKYGKLFNQAKLMPQQYHLLQVVSQTVEELEEKFLRAGAIVSDSYDRVIHNAQYLITVLQVSTNAQILRNAGNINMQKINDQMIQAEQKVEDYESWKNELNKYLDTAQTYQKESIEQIAISEQQRQHVQEQLQNLAEGCAEERLINVQKQLVDELSGQIESIRNVLASGFEDTTGNFVHKISELAQSLKSYENDIVSYEQNLLKTTQQQIDDYQKQSQVHDDLYQQFIHADQKAKEEECADEIEDPKSESKAANNSAKQDKKTNYNHNSVMAFMNEDLKEKGQSSSKKTSRRRYLRK